MHTKRRLLVAWLLASGWVVLGLGAFLVEWADDVALVWVAVVYANVTGSLALAQAADVTRMLLTLKRVEYRLELLENRAGGNDATVVERADPPPWT